MDGIRYEELAHVIVETEKPHDLPPASWRPGRAGGSFDPRPNAPAQAKNSLAFLRTPAHSGEAIHYSVLTQMLAPL